MRVPPVIFPGISPGCNHNIAAHYSRFQGRKAACFKPARQYMHFGPLIIGDQVGLVYEFHEMDIGCCYPAAFAVISLMVWSSRTDDKQGIFGCLLYTSPSPRDRQ